MLTTAVISFREFFEVFLIIGVFLGISRKLNLKKEKEIIFASCIGIFFSLVLAVVTYYYGNFVHSILNEKNMEILESYLMIFSGLFIAYVVFTLHEIIKRSHGGSFMIAKNKLKESTFDISLFITIVFLVLREGFEIALFTASTSLFSVFSQNIIGLMSGFLIASVVGITTFFAYTRFSIKKIFKVTEYLIIVLGASLVQNGFSKLLEHRLNIKIADFYAIHLNFLPSRNTPTGHMIKSFFGIDRDFSLVKLLIMGMYIFMIYLMFLKRRSKI